MPSDILSENEYDLWNRKKKYLSNSPKIFLFRNRDVWWCSLGLNLGSESFGKGEDYTRPVLVLRKLSKDTCIVLPLTTKCKIGSWFVEIDLNGSKRWVMLNQIRMINTRRFQRRIAILSKDDFHRIKEKLKILLEIF